MDDRVEIALGPARFVILATEPWAALVRDHFAEFRCRPALEPPDLKIVISRPPDMREPIRGLSPEISAWASGRTVFVRPTLTTRSILRLIKRLPNVDAWQRSRWLLLLRNGLEFPMLSILENDYGYLPVHSACLHGPRGAVLILGQNGAGKSTLAATASDRMGLHLGSDNYTPTDGHRALGFPGPPKAKPGDVLPYCRPGPFESPLRAVIHAKATEGIPKDPSIAVARFVLSDREAHHSTGWGSLADERAKNQGHLRAEVAQNLADLPNMAFCYQTDKTDAALAFIGAYCGRSI